MKGIILVASLIAFSAIYYFSTSSPVVETPQNLELAFQSFIQEHQKSYADFAEYEMRKGIFDKNLKMINEHNAKGKSWQMGMNHFGDLSDQEFEKMLGLKGRGKPIRSGEDKHQVSDPVPESAFDWATHGNGKAIHDVQNQGSCGSCWAFAVTASYETAYWKFTGEGTMIDFAEQQLVDCSFSYFNNGCRGGELSYAYQYLMDYKFEVENNYKYQAKD